MSTAASQLPAAAIISETPVKATTCSSLRKTYEGIFVKKYTGTNTTRHGTIYIIRAPKHRSVCTASGYRSSTSQ